MLRTSRFGVFLRTTILGGMNYDIRFFIYKYKGGSKETKGTIYMHPSHGVAFRFRSQ